MTANQQVPVMPPSCQKNSFLCISTAQRTAVESFLVRVLGRYNSYAVMIFVIFLSDLGVQYRDKFP